MIQHQNWIQILLEYIQKHLKKLHHMRTENTLISIFKIVFMSKLPFLHFFFFSRSQINGAPHNMFIFTSRGMEPRRLKIHTTVLQRESPVYCGKVKIGKDKITKIVKLGILQPDILSCLICKYIFVCLKEVFVISFFYVCRSTKSIHQIILIFTFISTFTN